MMEFIPKFMEGKSIGSQLWNAFFRHCGLRSQSVISLWAVKELEVVLVLEILLPFFGRQGLFKGSLSYGIFAYI